MASPVVMVASRSATLNWLSSCTLDLILLQIWSNLNQMILRVGLTKHNRLGRDNNRVDDWDMSPTSAIFKRET